MERCVAVFGVSILLAAHGVAAPVYGTRAFEPEHQETKELIALVEDASALVAARGAAAACEELSVPGSRWLFGDAYVFLLDMEGKTLCHPARPNLEGKILLELRDPAGKPIIRNLIRELSGGQEEGWEHYLWPRPGQSTFVWKSTYVHRVAEPGGREVVVGSGHYQMPMERFFIVDQVNDAAELIEAMGEIAFDTLRDPASGFRFYDAYIFVMDWSGVHLVNAGFPQYEGKNLLSLKDTNGKWIGREMLAALETRDAAWVDYMWPRPGEERASKKLSYVRRIEIEGKKLLVGGGLYAEE